MLNENHLSIKSSFQEWFSLNVWLGVFDDHLIGPHAFQGSLTSNKNLQFLKHYLPRFHYDIPATEREEIIFQHNGDLYILQMMFGTSWLVSYQD